MTDSSFTSGFIVEIPSEQDLYTDLKRLHTSNSGFNEIWELRRLGKRHILKSLQPHYAANLLYEKLLQKEFDIAYKLEHIHICRTLGWEKHPTLGNCILMEYIDGETLNECMESRPLTTPLAYKIIGEICDALQYIHSKQIIHRDLKPANILVTFNGQNVKLIDFGLSDCDDYHTLKIPAGTRHYIAPEQLRNNVKPDARADIYSLGVIIGEMADKLKNNRLRSIARKCMRMNREARYGTAAEVKEALTHRNNRKRYLAIAATVAAVAAAAYISINEGYTVHKDADKPTLPLAYNNSVTSPLYQQTLLAEKITLKHKTGATDEQWAADSVQMVNRLRQALDKNFPLPAQKQTALYRKQLEDLHQTVDRELSGLRTGKH